MASVTELLLILLLIYFLSCWLWVPAGRVIIARSLLSGWRLRSARSLWGNDRGVLFMQDPLPVLSAVVLSPFPLSVSPEGVYGRSPEDYGSGENNPDARFMRFEDIMEVEAAGSELHINGALFVRAGSAKAANELKHAIGRLAGSSSKRESLIRDLIRHTLNFKDANKGVDSVHRSISKLQPFCIALCFEMFVVLPLVGLRLGSVSLLVCLAIIALTNFVTVAVFRKAYIACCGKKPPGAEIAAMFLCFPKTARAFDVLKAELTVTFHPLEFAAAVDKGLLNDVARLVLAELMFSVRQRHPAEQYFRAIYCQVLGEEIQRFGLNSKELLAAPEQENEGAVSYCPLCRSQYWQSDVCSDCGVALQSF